MKPLKLYKHQQSFIDKNPDKALLCWEGGTGKTVAGAIWLAKGRDSNALVVCPKRVVKKWQTELIKWGAKGQVLSKEQFKKTPIRQYSAIVLDEADEFASPLFTKGRSQLTTHTYNLIKEYPAPILLLSATPIRSRSENLHTLLCFLGKYIEWKLWRDRFFTLEKLPYLPRPAYIPVKNWRTLIRPTLEKHADIVLLKDCVGELPPITEYKVNVKTIIPKDAVIENFYDEHRLEQVNKVQEILRIGKQYRKVMVVAYYTEEIDRLQKELSKDRPTFSIRGGVKDQEEIIKQAQNSDECFFICQSSLGAGFDADQFSAIIFASTGYSVRDWVQMKFRVRRIHNLHPVAFYYLLAGRCDKAVLHNLELGKDFIPSEWVV